MSKFCENCGAEMDDNQTICPNCGNGAQATNATQEPISEPTSSNTSTPKSGNAKNIAIIGGILTAVVVVIAIIASIFGKGYLKPIDNYFKGVQKANADTFLKAFPEFMNMGDSIEEDDMEDRLDDLEDTYGEKIKISYKVKSKEKIKKDELADIQEYIEGYYNEEVKVSAGYELKLAVTYKGKKKEKTNTDKYYVYKIDGKWCYFDVSPKTAKTYLKNK